MGGVRRVRRRCTSRSAAGLKILWLRRLGCARRFYLAVDAIEATGGAPTPAWSWRPATGSSAPPMAFGPPARRSCCGASATGPRCSPSSSRRRAASTCLPGRVVGLLAGATPRDERSRRCCTRDEAWRPTRLPRAIDDALRKAGFDLDARLFPAGGPVLEVEEDSDILSCGVLSRCQNLRD